MILNLISTKEILDFEKEIGFQLVVNEREYRQNYRLPKYYVSFESSWVSVPPYLEGRTGDGNTIDEALKDYCNKISNVKLVIDKNTRVEIKVPKLVHTKLLNS